ncbi:MAG: 50S ribosomal protein L14 [Candidatus Aenigmatarchaeota archaeon]|nr:50S ribosomal protein L14 [Candidatus Aenigmarchaeota archaeon]
MKGITSKITKALNVGSYLVCADNSGARILKIIAVRGYKGRRKRYPKAGLADMVKVSVVDGTPEVKKQLFWAVIIRQRKEIRRANGLRVKFEDNAAIIVNEEGEPRGTEIRGPVAKEVVERFSAIGKIASIVV